MRQIKTTELKLLREQLLLAQGYVCPLCLDHIEPDEAVLDHCHKTGQIRSVLHRGCNSLEGQITNSLPRNKITPQRLRNFLSRLINYQQQLKPLIHPTHKTPEEKKQRAKDKARQRRQEKTKKP
jgi:molybdopterin/thiamine biosynthesis adenylyltransferase